MRSNQISSSVPEVALMPRLLKIIISSSGMRWVEWSSVPVSLSRFSRIFLTTGLVVEQIERAIKTSFKFR